MVVVTEYSTPRHFAVTPKRVQWVSKGGHIQSISDLDDESVEAKDSSASAHYGDPMCVTQDHMISVAPESPHELFSPAIGSLTLSKTIVKEDAELFVEPFRG